MSGRPQFFPTRNSITILADRYSAWIVAILSILYVISFPIHRAPILAVIPVVAASWFYRMRGGLAASIIAFALSLFLVATLHGKNTWNYLINQESENFYLLGHFLLFVTAWGGAYLREAYDERIKAGSELRWRERYLTLLKLAVSSVLNPKKPNDRYFHMVTHLVNLFVADYGYFARLSPDKKQAVVVSTLSAGEQVLDLSSAANATILDARDILVIDDLPNSRDPIKAILLMDPAAPVRTVLGIPLAAMGRTLGLVLLAFASPRRFASVEINQMKEACEQLALIIWNIQQEIELQRKLREAEAMSDIALALSETERLGLQKVLQLIVSFAKNLIPGVEQAVIHLVDEDGQYLVPEALIGYENPEAGKRKMKIGEGVAGLAFERQELISIPDVTTDPRFIPLNPNSIIRSLIVIPIVKGRKNLGTLSVQCGIPNAFTVDDTKLLTALGAQAAVAIENAHLLESTRQALKETNALYHINQGLAALDADELLKESVELLKNNFDYYHVQVFVLNPATGNFHLIAASGEVGKRLVDMKHEVQPGSGIVGYVAETRSPFFTNDVDKVVFFMYDPYLPETRAEMAVPVQNDRRLYGILDIQQTAEKPFTKRDEQLVITVADQIAVALQKAELYEDLQTALQQEKATRNQLIQNERLVVMGRLLASVSHELNNPLQAIQNALFLLKEEKGMSEQGRNDLEIVIAESERMAGMIERLRNTYRLPQAEDLQPTHINNIVEDVYALLATHLRKNRVAFEFHPDQSLPVIHALPDQIRQILLNLMVNAVEAMPEGGTLIVDSGHLADTNEILISISDTGAGISPVILPFIFDPFVTNKKRGTGLGLTITHDIIIKHRGRIVAENRPQGTGAVFKVWLPTDPLIAEGK